MKRIGLIGICMTCVAFAMPSMSLAQAGPSTRPGAARGDGARRSGVLIDRLHDAMADLKLSDQQKRDIDSIFNDARLKLREMAPELQQLPPQERQQRAREFMLDVREKIMAVLDDEQKPMFEKKLSEMRENPRGERQMGGGLLERFRDAIEQLNLSDEQREKVKELQTQMAEKARAIRTEAQGDAQMLRQKMREMGDELREKAGEILTSEQREKLRELMREVRERAAPGQARPEPPPAPPPPSDEQKPAPPANGDGDKPKEPRAMAPPGSEKLRVGQSAPVFALQRLDGRNIQLSSFRGKIVVMLFGSYSSPSFRERAADFEQLNREYGRRAEFLIIYTREAHPVGEPEVARNKLAGIAVEQPRDMPARIELAKRARESLNLTVPIAIDSLDEKTASDYDAFNAAAIIVGRDGVVMARQNWFDATRMRRQLDELLNR